MYIGIDLGGTHVAAGLVSTEGKVLAKADISSNVRRSYQEIVKDMADLCMKLMKETGVDKSEIKSIGIGCPGTCDNERGILVYSNNFNFYNAPIREELKKYLDLPVHLENDANCAALAEYYFGAARGTSSSVTITLGTGLGGGIIINGKVFSGFNFAGSELGHMVIEVDGEQCTCGRKGCWEAYSSATGLVRYTVKTIGENRNTMIYNMVDGDTSKINGKMIFDAARQGDRVAQEIISDYVRYLAEGITNIINIIMPEVFVIGGGISKQGNYLLEPIKELVENKAYVRGDTPKTEIRMAVMENDAGMIGAAMLGR